MSKILVRLSFINIALVVRSVTSTPAYADGAAQIKERQELMKSIGVNMKAIGWITKGKGDATSIGAHTAELAPLSKKVGAAFRVRFGLDAGKAYTKLYIWTNQAAFNKTVAQLVPRKDNLAKAGLLAISKPLVVLWIWSVRPPVARAIKPNVRQKRNKHSQ